MKRIIAIALLPIIAVLVPAVIACLWYNHDSKQQLEEIRQMLRKSGAPMTIQEALPLPIPDDQNAAKDYDALRAYLIRTEALQKAHDDLRVIAEEEWGFTLDLIYTFQIEEDDWKLVDEVLEREPIREYFRHLDRITSKPYFRPDWNWDAGPNMLIPEVGMKRNATQWLFVRAAGEIQAGHCEAATEALNMAATLTQHTADGRVLISLLTAVSQQGLAFSFAESASLQCADCSVLESEIWKLDMVDYWTASLDLERIGFGGPIFEALLAGDRDFVEEFAYGGPLPWHLRLASFPLTKWILRYDYVAYLEVMRQVSSIADPAYPEFKERYAKIEARIENADGNLSDEITQILVPSYKLIRRKLDESNASCRIARTAIALGAFAKNEGSFPVQLTALVPSYLEAVPQDPFSGKPLKYEPRESGFALYSIGPNLRDDDETTNVEGYADEDAGDLIWAGQGSALERKRPQY